MRACKTIIMIEMSSKCNCCTQTLRQMKIFVSTPVVSRLVQALPARSNQRLIITINTTAVVRPMFLVTMMYGILSTVQTTSPTGHYAFLSSQLTWEPICQYRTQSCGSNALIMIMINDNNRYKNSKCSY